MEKAFNFFINAFRSIIYNVGQHTQFSVYGLNVNLIDILLGGILLSMIISVFWKGAKG